MSNLIDVVDGINRLSVSLNAACLLSSGTEQEREVSYSLLLISAELASSLAKEDFLPRRQSSNAQPCNSITAETIGTRILGQRLSCGLNQMQLAEMVGVPRSTVDAWEKGEAVPGGCALDQLAADLECDPHWLLTGEGRPTPAVNNEPPLYAPYDGGLPLSDRIQLARENLGLTEADVARKLGTHCDHISDWECGITEPPASMVIPLASALKCDPLWLLGGFDATHQSLATQGHQSQRQHSELLGSGASVHASHHARNPSQG